MHRDLKGANLLMNNKGVLKIADFGLGRWLGGHQRNFTSEVVTFPYRAPELMMGYTKYDTKIDMWSIGCILGELLVRRVMFANKKPLD